MQVFLATPTPPPVYAQVEMPPAMDKHNSHTHTRAHAIFRYVD